MQPAASIELNFSILDRPERYVFFKVEFRIYTLYPKLLSFSLSGCLFFSPSLLLLAEASRARELADISNANSFLPSSSSSSAPSCRLLFLSFPLSLPFFEPKFPLLYFDWHVWKKGLKIEEAEEESPSQCYCFVQSWLSSVGTLV